MPNSRSGVPAGSNWHGIQIRHLAALEAVASERSFNRAARKLGYTQSAISHQIAVLERIVGERLLTRPQAGAPRVAPTAAGVVLLTEARRILARLQETHLELASVRQGATPRFASASNAASARSSCRRCSMPSASRAPHLEVDLVERRHVTDLWDLLDEGAVDLVVASVRAGVDGGRGALASRADRGRLRSRRPRSGGPRVGGAARADAARAPAPVQGDRSAPGRRGEVKLPRSTFGSGRKTR